MDKSAADAFVWAKACGKLSKSFYGKNSEKLFAVHSLSELYGLLFSGDVPALPETLLAKEIEEKAENAFLSDYIDFLNCYDKPALLPVTLLELYDYNNLKTFAGALCMHESERPSFLDLGKYALLSYDKWPEIDKITENSELSWYNEVPEIAGQQVLDSKMDFQYLTKLWKSACACELSVREQTKALIAREIRFSNILWVLRLKVYYKMNSEEILPRLFFEDSSKGKEDFLAGDAVKILTKDTSKIDDWKNWKYKEYINPCVNAEEWELDPRWVEKCFQNSLENEYISLFHRNSLSSLALVCYFKIKQNELSNIRSITEGLRLGGE